MELIQTEIAVVGGGASGLMAAITAAQTLKRSGAGGRVMVLEAQPRVGRKLLATGNGRCNLSAADVDETHYHTDAPQLLSSVLSEIPDAQAFFASMGLLCRYDQQRMYPYSNQAGSVLDCLRRNEKELGIAELCDCFVKEIRPGRTGITVVSAQKVVTAKRVILATGGPAAGYLGANDSGIGLAASLGMSAEPVFASLTPVRVKDKMFASLKGIRCCAQVRLICDGTAGQPEDGEVQFTENGLSGICVFGVSRRVNEFFTHGTVEGVPCKSLELSLDLMPEYSRWQIEKMLDAGRLEESLCGIFHKRIAAALSAGGGTAGQLAQRIKDWRFRPSGASQLSTAQVTAGGVRLGELNENFCTKKCKGVYLAGELLNVDGDCGGYNLHFAWASGVRAGRNAALSLIGE